MQCVYLFFGICFVPVQGTASLFSFKDFIAALALLIIVYTVSDIRYRFRVAVAPISLFKITYGLIALIGFGTLATDIWISEKWLRPNIGGLMKPYHIHVITSPSSSAPRMPCQIAVVKRLSGTNHFSLIQISVASVPNPMKAIST